MMFPYEDFYRTKKEINATAVLEIKHASARIEHEGGIDFEQVQLCFQKCQDLLYHNQWSET
jgi:phage host-nuclease inhibitor protein Gam